eukprot:scaffold2526_cov131-Cylindrotheca_fusiformis.AAC.10
MPNVDPSALGLCNFFCLMTPTKMMISFNTFWLLDTKGVGYLERWVAWFTPFFNASIQKAKRLPSAVKLTTLIRSIFSLYALAL